jgi:16S rRNA (cytosine967-C5)-methyltransferase
VKSKPSAPRAAISSARSAAFDILFRVERESSYASELLHSWAYDGLTETDHALATELVMGVLRWRSLLDSEIGRNSSQPVAKLDLEVLIALRLAVYQLRWLDRIPARAAINESVNLVKRARKHSAAPFVNAVLRKIAAQVPATQETRRSEINSESAEALADSSAHSQWLVERWVNDYGLDSTARICEYDQSRPTTAIRLRRAEAEDQLQAEGIELAAGALLASARRVLRGDVTRTSAFRAGLCVIQDEASQLVAALVGHGSGILDCCAAPGGKTLAIADRNPNAKISALELHPHRARLLQKLLSAPDASIHARSFNIQVVAADAKQLPFSTEFDRVLTDVPCSGTGTLSRNPEIKWRLTAKDFADLQTRQLAILRSAMERVAIGGNLIYSTCSLEREENEDVIERALAEDSSFRLVDCRIELERLRMEGELTWENLSSLTRGPYFRTLPGVHPCDGFFAAILQKS